MSAYQKKEIVVSASAKIVKRGDTYVLVDTSMVFPDGVWDLIKSYAIPTPVNYEKVWRETQAEYIQSVAENYSKKEVAKTISHFWGSVLTVCNPQHQDYKETTKENLIKYSLKCRLDLHRYGTFRITDPSRTHQLEDRPKKTQFTKEEIKHIKGIIKMMKDQIQTKSKKSILPPH
jgi:hypothetical protein